MTDFAHFPRPGENDPYMHHTSSHMEGGSFKCNEFNYQQDRVQTEHNSVLDNSK